MLLSKRFSPNPIPFDALANGSTFCKVYCSFVKSQQLAISISSREAACLKICSSQSIPSNHTFPKSSGSIASGDVIIIKNGGQTGTFTVMVKGDTNGDGKISISDLAMIKAKLLGNNNLNGVYLSAADINKDGKISISDLAMVKAHLLGTLKITK